MMRTMMMTIYHDVDNVDGGCDDGKDHAHDDVDGNDDDDCCLL